MRGWNCCANCRVRNDAVALLLADQRMPQMDGIGFLNEARKVYPDAKRALLTAYADTGAAINAINEVNVHYFFLKPWDPPSQHLYPVIDDLLEDWTASYRPAYEGIRVLGTRWSSKAYDVRDFLARNHVPYQWIDVELSAEDPEVKQLIASVGDDAAKATADLVSRWHAHVSVESGRACRKNWPEDAGRHAVL